MSELRNVISLSALLFLTACDSGGKIEFRDGSRVNSSGTSSISLVPAGIALATEPGKYPSNGYHAKLEINPVQGQILRSTSGYELKIHNTRRTR